MYDDLLEEAAKRVEDLRKKLSIVIPQAIREKVMFSFKKYEFGVSEGLRGITKIVGVDGGSYCYSTMAFDLYLIKVYSVAVSQSFNGDLRMIGESKIIDIDFMIPPHKVGDRLNLYRDVGEVKVAMENVESSTLVLADGSIESLLTRPTHLKLEQLDKYVGYIDHYDVEKTVLNSNTKYNVVSVKKLVEKLVETQDFKDEKELEIKTNAAELSEKAIIIREFLKRILHNKAIVVFVTKTGRSNRLFQRHLPDQYILSVITKEPGFLLEDETVTRLSREVRLPQAFNLREYASKIGLLRGYARLDRGAQIMRVEVIAPLDIFPSDLEGFFTSILDRISSVCVNGYPYPLILAHQKAHIEKRSAEVIIEALGFRGEFTGREAIEHV